MRKLLLILGIFLWASQVWGATYYMRADGTASNKAAATSCSSASTAMSVATHNSQIFSPDDVICLCDDGGVYKTSIIVPSTGTRGHPIVYRNANGKTPVIDVSYLDSSSGWTDLGTGIYTKQLSVRPWVMWENDVPLKVASSTVCSDGNWFGYNNSQGLTYYKPTSGTPAKHSLRFVHGTTPAGMDIRNKSYLTIYGLTLNRCWYGIRHGSDKTNANVDISGLSIHDNNFNKVYWAIYGDILNDRVESDVTIYNNLIDYCNCGISAWSGSKNNKTKLQYNKNFSITNNTIINHAAISDSMTWADALMNLYWFSDHEGISFQDVQNSTIADNKITVSYSQNFSLGSQYATRGIYIYQNTSARATSGNKILRNKLTGHFSPAIYMSGYGASGYENNIIAYNVMSYSEAYNVQSFFSVNFEDANTLTGTNYFANNTIYAASNIGACFRMPNKLTGTWIVRNNIMRSGGSYVNISSYQDSGTLTFDHNLYYGKPDQWGFQIGVTGMTFITWKNRGYDLVGSRIADPLFTNAPRGIFTINSSSPAKWAGVNLGLSTDYAGKPVHNPPSIGAYEYVESKTGSSSLRAPTGFRRGTQ